MSDRDIASAGDATPGVVSETETGAAASATAAGATEKASGSGDRSSQDYIRRVQTDPDFAAREVTSHQSRADKAVAEKKSLEERLAKLGRYQGDDPEVIARSLDEYVTWKTNPEIQRMIDKIQSGASASPDGEGDDDFLSDEQKEIRELRKELQETQQRIVGTELSFGQQALIGHIEKVSRDYHLTQELFDTAKKIMQRNVDEWATRASSGDKSAQQAIKNLQGSQGYKTVRALMLGELDPDALLDAQKNRDSRKKQGLDALATDGLPRAASTGREPPPDFSKSANVAIQAAQWAEQHPDEHDSY